MRQTILTIQNRVARTFDLCSLSRGSDDIDTLSRSKSKRLYTKEVPDEKSDIHKLIYEKSGRLSTKNPPDEKSDDEGSINRKFRLARW